MDIVGRVCRGLVRWWPGCLVLAAVYSVLAWGPSRRLEFDQSIESLYASDNPRLVDFRESKRIFGGDEFVVLAYRDPQLFASETELTEAASSRLDELQSQLSEIPGVDPASIQTLAEALRSPYGRTRIREFATGLLLGSDGQTTAVVTRILPVDDSPVSRAETFARIRALAATQPLPTVVVGEPIQVFDMFRYVEEDGRTLGWWSATLLMGVIFLLFRSWRWMLLPLLVVQAALLWTKALLVLSGMQLSMVSSMLNSLAMIIGIATTMHLTLRFRELRLNLDREAALLQSLRDLALPVTWTILTTAAGFAALISSRIAPSASFGVMMTLTTLQILVACLLLLPGGILLGRKTTIPAVPLGETWLVDRLGELAQRVERHPWRVGGIFVIASVVCTLGLLRLEIETDFSKNFRATSPIVQALHFFEDHLGGAGTWEVNFSAPETLDETYLVELRGLAQDLRQLEDRSTTDRLTKVVALSDGLDVIPANILFTRLSVNTRLNLMNAVQPEFAATLYNPDAGRMRIMLRGLERQPSESKLKLIAEVEQIAQRRFPEARATGLFVLLAYLIESLLSDQIVSSLLAAAGIVCLMSLAQRSLILGMALLLPNLFPIVLVIGTMGWIGMKVNIASAMIASVSMGLTIDSSIHYLAGYRRHRREGSSRSQALRQTHRETGLALVLSNLALVAGFSVLTLSHFIPLIYFGVLVSVAMIGGLIGNLLLMPLIILILDRTPDAKNSETAVPKV